MKLFAQPLHNCKNGPDFHDGNRNKDILTLNVVTGGIFVKLKFAYADIYALHVVRDVPPLRRQF